MDKDRASLVFSNSLSNAVFSRSLSNVSLLDTFEISVSLFFCACLGMLGRWTPMLPSQNAHEQAHPYEMMQVPLIVVNAMN